MCPLRSGAMIAQVSQHEPSPPYRRAKERIVNAFKVDLGAFAGKHIDRKDSPGGVTCMVTSNHLSEGVHPGFFLIGELGVAIGLS